MVTGQAKRRHGTTDPQRQVAVLPLYTAATMLRPHDTRQVAGSVQLVTVQPVLGQVTEQPLAGHATSQLFELWHDTEQLADDLQSTSQLGAPLHATEHASPASQVRLQSWSAVQTQLLLPAHVSSVPQPAAVRVQAVQRSRLSRNFISGLLERLPSYAAAARHLDITATSPRPHRDLRSPRPRNSGPRRRVRRP